jgi:hypothetical protein
MVNRYYMDGKYKLNTSCMDSKWQLNEKSIGKKFPAVTKKHIG